MNGRIYDPLLGRMLSADLMVQNPRSLQCFNRYSYVQNNPLTLTDPTGWYSVMGLEFTDGGGVGGFFKDVATYTTDATVAAGGGAGHYAVGLAQGANAVATGTVNALADPVGAIHGAIQGTANTMGTLAGQIVNDPKGLANQVVSDLSDPQKLGQAVGNAVTGTATAVMAGQAAGAAKGALSETRLAEAAPKAEAQPQVNPTAAPTTEASRDVAYRYVGGKEAAKTTGSDVVPNTTAEGKPKDVSMTFEKFDTVKDAESALKIGSQDPRGTQASPTHRVTVDITGAKLSYAGNGDTGGAVEIRTSEKRPAISIDELKKKDP